MHSDSEGQLRLDAIIILCHWLKCMPLYHWPAQIKKKKTTATSNPALFSLSGVWAPGPGCSDLSIQNRDTSLHWFGNIQGGSGNI